MGRDILSEYGPDKTITQQPRASTGGEPERSVSNYDPPKGPIGIFGPYQGIGGTNVGNAGSQGTYYRDEGGYADGAIPHGLPPDETDVDGSQGER